MFRAGGLWLKGFRKSEGWGLVVLEIELRFPVHELDL